MVAATFSKTMTSTAPPATNARGGSIGFVIGMALRALRLLPIAFAVETPSLILGQCDRFQMRRVHTMADSAKVIKFEAMWNRANKPFITQAVGLLKDLIGYVELPITGSLTGSPKPTGAKIRSICGNRPIVVDLLPKTFLDRPWMVSIWHGYNYSNIC